MLLFAVKKTHSPAAGFVEFSLDGSTLLTFPDASTLPPSTSLRGSEQRRTVGVPPFDGLRDAERESKREQSRRERSQGLGMRDTLFH
jgi:hypothetical protein